ncbi:MAG: acyltransferase family protein, partial [Afipia sp.]
MNTQIGLSDPIAVAGECAVRLRASRRRPRSAPLHARKLTKWATSTQSAAERAARSEPPVTLPVADQQSGCPMASQRLRALDGLRGVAILLVMGFHYFYHLESYYYKSTLYPYGETFSNVLVFKYGYMGVELFFIISGFVIAMTLESSRSVIDFVIRRFVRIWPALIVSA